MILRRLADAIREQNWFTVVLEVLIVVVGIFIGLQVDDWNDARKDRALERDFLQRLAADLKADIDVHNIGALLAQERQAYGEFLMASVEDPSLVRADPSRFITALAKAGYTFSPPISDQTFEEIKSSGQLSILQNVQVRSDLVRYYTRIRSYSQWNYLREQKQTEYNSRSPGILEYRHAKPLDILEEPTGISVEEAMAAHQRMIERPAYIEWLPVAANRGSDIRTYQQWSEMAADLLAAIQLELADNNG